CSTVCRLQGQCPGEMADHAQLDEINNRIDAPTHDHRPEVDDAALNPIIQVHRIDAGDRAGIAVDEKWLTDADEGRRPSEARASSLSGEGYIANVFFGLLYLPHSRVTMP